MKTYIFLSSSSLVTVRQLAAAIAFGLRPMLMASLIGLAGCGTLPAGFSEGGVITVRADGSGDYSSIQKAVQAAPPRAVIRIGPGVFEEHVTIDKPLTIEGSGWDQTTLTSQNKVAEVMTTLKVRMKAAKTDEELAVIVEKVRRRLEEEWARSTLVVTGTEGVVVRNLKLSWPGSHFEGGLAPGAIVALRGARASIAGCAVVDSLASGIHIGSGSDVEIRDCLVAAVWNTGVVVGERSGSGGHARISGCDVRNCYYAGICIRAGSADSVVERCRISGSAWHGIRYDNASPAIVGNLIFGNARSGIYASGETRATVKGNVFYKNEMDGMSCWFQNRDSIARNTFVHNLREALCVVGASEPAIRRNVFVGHPQAIISGDIGSDSPFAKAGSGLHLDHNLFWENQLNAATRRPMSEGKVGEIFELPLIEDAGNVVVDPLFVSAADRDFSFAQGSHARRHGIGAADPITFASPWPLQPEEQAIIPDGDTRDSRQWKSSAEETPGAKSHGTRGRISGVVLNAATGEPVAGAFVAIDHSGDAGGANLRRLKKQGIYVTAESDDHGRFVLDGVAFMSHPFYVTCPRYIRYERTLTVQQSPPGMKVGVRLEPAATINVTVIDAGGRPVRGPVELRIEANSGHLFVSMKQDWPRLGYRSGTITSGGAFSFGELHTDVYLIEAIRMTPSGPRSYHGAVSGIDVKAGETKDVVIQPADHQTRITLNVAEDPYQHPDRPAILVVSRNAGLLLWADNRFHHPEDDRLGRVMANALLRTQVPSGGPSSLENLPPGTYGIFVITIGQYKDFKGLSVYMRGARADVTRGVETTVEIPWVEPQGPAWVKPWAFGNRAAIDAKAYSARDLCELLAATAKGKVAFDADPAIENETVAFDRGSMSVWELLEFLYLNRGWTVVEERGQALVLRPRE